MFCRRMKERLYKLETTVLELTGDLERLAGQVEAMSDAQAELGADVRRSLARLDEAMDAQDREASKAERLRQEGMDAIFGYMPASMKESGNG